MSSVWNKLDSGLSSIYAAYLAGRAHPMLEAGDGRLNVSIQYRGDLASIEALGFQPVWKERPGRSTGAIHLQDLERLAAHPEVDRIAFGQEREPMLDISVPDIRANLVWTFTNPPPVFDANAGSKAIVGVIDSGIDFRHPFFLETGAVTPTTRILRIWDPGLVPTGAETSPDPALLSGGVGGPTYGVEYKDTHINAILRGTAGAMKVRHRDCVGHGTHVTSIAAGSGATPFTFIGVAPTAGIIMVKFLALQTPPKVGGVPVGPDQLLKDAIAYIRNTAAALGKPVAINYSIGSNLGPHDGFTDDEDFLTETFKASSGTVFVSAAGNSGGTRRHHARIDFPVGGGSVDVPMELFDPRTNRRIFDTCDWKNGTNRLFIQLYYPDGPTAITVSIDIPKDGAGFVAGPAFGAAPVTGSVKNRDWTMTHSNDNNTLRGGTTIQRRLFEFEIEPFRNRHVLGQYMLRVSSPAALTVHIWGQQARGYGFRVDTAPPVPANVFVVPESTIGSDGGAANILTVAAYNAEVTPALPITDFSSRGPLVSYGGGPAQPSKPDIAAPGEKIDAAKSRDEKPPRPGNTTQKKGTSMAAPHVTGAAALLLGMKPALTTKEVIDTIRNFARTVPPATVDEAGSGRLDAKNSFDNIP